MLASEQVIYILLCFGEIVLLAQLVALTSVFTFLDESKVAWLALAIDHDLYGLACILVKNGQNGPLGGAVASGADLVLARLNHLLCNDQHKFL